MAAKKALRTYLQAMGKLNRDVRLFLVSAVAGGVCYMGLYFLLINLYLLRLGYDLEFIGLFVATGAFSFALSSLPASMVGRRWGSRRPMIFGMTILALGLAMLALSALVPTPWRSVWLIFFCALREFGNSFYLVNANPYLMQASSPTERDYAFSLRGTLTPLAAFVGTLAGGWLPQLSAYFSTRPIDDPLNYMAPLLLSALLLLPGVVALSKTREVEDSEPHTAQRERGAMPVKALATIALISLLFIVTASAGQSFYNVYMDTVLHAPTQLIGAIASCGQLLSVVLMLAAPALMKRWGHGRSFVLMALGMALSLLPMALVPHWSAAGLGIIGIVTLMAFSSTALTIFHQELVPVAWRPVMSGASLMAMGIGWGIVSSGGGYFVAAWGWPPFFLLAASVTALGAVLFGLRFVWGQDRSH